MNREQYRTLIKNFINEPDVDEQIDMIVNSAIQDAYDDLSLTDKKVSATQRMAFNGILQLPDDCMSVISITPSIPTDHKRVGNNIVHSDLSGMYTVQYVAVRELIEDDTTDLELHQYLNRAVMLYGAATYFDYRKKTGQSQWLLQQYDIRKRNFEGMIDSMEEVQRNVYRGDIDE